MELILLWMLTVGLAGYYIGKSRGHADTGCCLGFLLGPIGWIITACLPPRGGAMCPFCRERVQPKATICPHCRAERTPPP